MSYRIGQIAEQKACEFLLSQGLQLITRNFRCQYGELDLVMQQLPYLVIVEVRYRRYAYFGGAIPSITLNKRNKLIATTLYYQQLHPCDLPIRFDVIGYDGQNCQWIMNAFQIE
ncbi:MAG: hypothetical protein RL637_1617 [Pseudomonadota bacterium]|jgi:putative endonuclease